MNPVLDYLVPDSLDRVMLLAGSVVGAVVSFCFGGWTPGLTWLGALAIADFVLGSIAAWRTGEWNSDAGSQGVKRKVALFAFITIAHGIDVTLAESGMDILSFMAMTVTALTVTEAGSIVENIDRMGNGHLIPPVIRRGLKSAREAVDKRLNEKLGGEK